MRAAASMARPGPESRASAEARGEGEPHSAYHEKDAAECWVFFILQLNNLAIGHIA